jgi:hypothetical protein
MSDDDGRVLAQRVEQADHVAHVVELGVLIDGLGLVRPAVAAHVGRDGVVTRGGEAGS